MSKKSINDLLDPEVLARIKKLNLYTRNTMNGSFAGIHKSPFRGSSVEFSQFREYTPGDDIRRIDWKMYARSDRYYIKEYEATTNLNCYIVLDKSRSMQFASGETSKFDFALKIAATLSNILISQGDGVGMFSFNDKLIKNVSPKTTPKHLYNIYELLCSIEADGSTDLVESLNNLSMKIKKRSLVIIISDFFSDIKELSKCFAHLNHNKNDVVAFHVMDQQELNFDIEAPTRFVGMESSDDVIADPNIIKDDYLKAINMFLDALKKKASTNNVEYRLLTPQGGYEDVLSDFLTTRIQGK